jgi:dTDP-4-dehydrorhamnose 3,5-epimerase
VIFRETPLAGVWVVELERIEDERGFFARTYAADEFRSHGLDPTVGQCSVSFNRARGTLRGLHFNADPYGECKLIRCTRGGMFDVAVDVRPGSETYKRWFGLELTPDNGLMIYLPEGIAHGFQTLEDATEVAYQISRSYEPTHARGVRFDDPAFGIAWPLPVSVIAQRDREYPNLDI